MTALDKPRCAYPDPTPEWPCSQPATHMVIGLYGSGWYEKPMPRCNAHLAATIDLMRPTGSPYPYYVLGRVEPIK